MPPDSNNPGSKPKNPFAASSSKPLPSPQAPADSGSGARIFCPACGILVKLPATECPQCHANLRTGEKPEEYVPLWKRGMGKLTIILLTLTVPSVTWALVQTYTEEGLFEYIKGRLGIESCIEPRDMWDDFDQEKFVTEVKSGYGTWNKSANSRNVGQDPNGPETPEQAARPEHEKILQSDNRNYFASTLMSPSPSNTLKEKDNWYASFPGEWDLAYIIDSGLPSEQIIAGEWTFAWINDGDALQDVMSVPFRWQKDQIPDFVPIQTTTTRIFNPKLFVWEGFHILDSQLVFFRAARSQNGSIVEHYQVESGPLVVTTYNDITDTSFMVTISQSTNNGATYSKVAEIWAKKRNIIIP